MKTYNRKKLEQFAASLGLNLCNAGRQTKMDAIGRDENVPRWELNDWKHADSVRGFATLAEVAEHLEQIELRCY